jgi:uncharacterized membrane protein YeiH
LPLASLRAVGYSGAALARSLSKEALVLSAAALACFALSGTSVGLAMSAVELRVDAVSVLVGFGGVLLLGLLGTLPAAVRVVRLPTATARVEP